MEDYESAAQITFTINGTELPILSIDGSKEVNIEQIRANNLKPIGYSVTEIDISGSMTFEGNGFLSEIGVQVEGVKHLEDFFTDDDGIPIDGSTLTIYHENENVQTVYDDVMISTDGYETESGEVSGVSFDFIAGDRDRQTVN